MSADLAKLSGIKILVSQYIEDDVMVVSPKTCEKLQSWYGSKTEPKETKESEGA